MITREVTTTVLEKWKEIFEDHAFSMAPNRKPGKELDIYFKSNYSFQTMKSDKIKQVLIANITTNEYLREKLPQGVAPQIQCYTVGNVRIGIDLVSGGFHIECEEIDEAIPIYDDLFVYRGLDEADLKNYVMVGQYVELTQK